MSRKIEDAFNECFERLLSGESLESCLRSYPEHAAELDLMLRTAFDVKRKAYPVQPRPEFKYWSRIRMQGMQHSTHQYPPADKESSFNIRRNLAISLAAIMVFVLASSGTAAASSDAMPDQPLYDVKLAVEQVELTFTQSDTARAELFAGFVEKRAKEIAVMAGQGKTDKVLSTTTRMYYQLDQAEQLLANVEAANKETSATTFSVPPAPTINAPVSPAPATPTTKTPVTAVTPPTVTAPSSTSAQDQKSGTGTPLGSQSGSQTGTQSGIESGAQTGAQSATQSGTQSDSKAERESRSVMAASKAKLTLNASAAKTLTILQDALDKAPDSVKPSLSAIIERTRTTNERFNARSLHDQSSGLTSDNSTVKVYSDNVSAGTDKHQTITPVKPKVPVPQTVVPSDNTSKTRGNSRFSTFRRGFGNTDEGEVTDDTIDTDNQTRATPTTTTIALTVVGVATPSSYSTVISKPAIDLVSPTTHKVTTVNTGITAKVIELTDTLK